MQLLILLVRLSFSFKMHVTYQAIKISSLSLLSSSDSNVEQLLCNLECFHDTRPPSSPVFMFQFLKSS